MKWTRGSQPYKNGHYIVTIECDDEHSKKPKRYIECLEYHVHAGWRFRGLPLAEHIKVKAWSKPIPHKEEV